MSCVTEVRIPYRNDCLNLPLLEGLFIASHYQSCSPSCRRIPWQAKGHPQMEYWHIEAKNLGEERFLELICRIVEEDTYVFLRHESSDHFTRHLCKPAGKFKTKIDGVPWSGE